MESFVVEVAALLALNITAVKEENYSSEVISSCSSAFCAAV